MILARDAEALRAEVSRWRSAGDTIGFVPTMGFLHEGHLSLVDEARSHGATRVVVSIFVNPKQFGAGEDLDRYPRDEERDRSLLEKRGVDLLFAPGVDGIYPSGFATEVRVSGVSVPLEGERRPGHFDGVATVVLKLLNLVQPDLAVFGRKDAQQCAVVRQMVRDLALPVQLVFGETVREADGLAMSSRNAYLRDDERPAALALSRALRAGREAAAGGGEVSVVERAMRETLARTPEAEIDYLVVVDPLTFQPPSERTAEWLLAGAIRVGKTRLIDNMTAVRKELPEEAAGSAGERGMEGAGRARNLEYFREPDESKL